MMVARLFLACALLGLALSAPSTNSSAASSPTSPTTTTFGNTTKTSTPNSSPNISTTNSSSTSTPSSASSTTNETIPASTIDPNSTSTTPSSPTTTDPNATTPVTATRSNTTVGPTPTHPSPRQIVGELKKGIIAGGWIPFVIFIGISIVFSWSFIGFYQHKREREFSSTLVAILGVVVALLTCSLIPVDIYLVSHFKSDDGAFQDWALNNYVDVTDTVRYAYYAVYSLVVLFIFFIIPLTYFYFEAKDEVEDVSCMSRLTTSFKFTLGFLIVMGVIMCIGAFAISTNGSSCDDESDADVKSAAECRARFAESALTSNGGNNAISFTIGLLTTIGVGYFTYYTAWGFVAMPVDMIRRRGSNKEDREIADDQLRINREKADEIRNKKRKGKMKARDRRMLEKYENEERVLEQVTRRADSIEKGFCGRLGRILRPFEFIFGIAFFILGIFIVICLAMTAGDKLLQIRSQHLDWKTGYTHAAPKLLNPVDLAMTTFSKAFPVDYVLLSLIIYFFLFTTMSGVRHLGVRFCGLKVFEIRPQRTVPQGLLFMCTILMFTLLFLNVVLLTLAPQYVTYGDQQYSVLEDVDGKCTLAAYPTGNTSQCSSEAPEFSYFIYNASDTDMTQRLQISHDVFDEKSGQCNYTALATCLKQAGSDLPAQIFSCEREPACVQTRVAAILHAFFYNLWFFSAIYYWANWMFVLVYIIGLVYLTCTRRKSLIRSLASDAKNDFYESDDDMVPFSASWAK